jgi:hypothetical protein
MPKPRDNNLLTRQAIAQHEEIKIDDNVG